ncbi:MAG: HAD family hydrolase [Treponema sp.]|uniref:HAD family hydrolase n=1 Tax=Treponema sp. TaxID=166 RepID=UPI00298E05BA|nr:HAD family hydrolase [Treponema sp.]MBR5932751.1 HAD family hydrolase [Treponema sp.]
MKVYKIPENLKTIIFDIDSTLYTNSKYAFEQVDVQLRHLAELRGVTPDKIRKMIADFRAEYSKKNDDAKISLGNTLTYFGVTIEDSIKMRETLLEPAEFLSRDDRLIKTLEKLSKKYKMIAVTNNPVLPAFKTLEAIGIEKLIPDIIGLDTCHKSKPHPDILNLAAEKTGARLTECLSVGDRYDIDLSLALEMGMGAILVTGVEDVYELDGVLK